MLRAIDQKPIQSPLGKRLWWLISGRAAAVILLVLVGTIWRWGAPSHGLNNSIRTVAPIIVTVAGLTVTYSVVRLFWKNFWLQAVIQLAVDVLLVTWLVWTTGNV